MAVLGILGGLGPLATACLYTMIVEHTKASRDCEHIDTVISSRASTPDRTAFILGESRADPRDALIGDAKRLEAFGADVIVIPCNTAHYFLGDIRAAVSIPVLNMIELTVSHCKRQTSRVGLMATDGSVKTGIYARECEKQGIELCLPDEAGQKKIMSFIYDDIKGGREIDKSAFCAEADRLFERGCGAVILGCTELAVLKDKFGLDARYADTLAILAKSAIEFCGKETLGFEE